MSMQGNLQTNLGAAISCFEAALKIYNRDETPVEWAATQQKLGNAYRHLQLEIVRPTSSRPSLVIEQPYASIPTQLPPSIGPAGSEPFLVINACKVRLSLFAPVAH